MAIKKELDIDVSTGDADTKLDKLITALGDVSDNMSKVKNSSKKTADGIDDLNKSAKNTKKGFSVFGKGLKGIMSVIKGAVVFQLLITAFQKIGEVLGQNEKIMKIVNTIFETMSIAVNQLVERTSGLIEGLSKANGGFDATKKVVMNLLKLAITPLKTGFNLLKLGVLEAQLIFEKSFLGDKDANKIEELTASITETKDSIKQIAQEALESGKAVVKNFGEAVSEVSEVASGVVDIIKTTNIKAINEQAKNLIELRKQAVLARAENDLLLQQYDKQAEEQRQIRDNVQLTIKERQEANDKLGVILKDQLKLQLQNANLAVLASKKELDANASSTEAQEAYINALKERADVQATVTGFESEQLVNKQALEIEAIELENTRRQGEEDRRKADVEFRLAQEADEVTRLELMQENLLLEAQFLNEDFERKKGFYKEGTQARIDFENEYKSELQRINNEIVVADTESTAKRVSNAEIVRKANIANAERGIQAVGTLLGKGDKIAKAFAVRDVVRDGIKGVQSAYSTAQKSPITAVFPGYPILQAGLAGAFSAVQLKQILKSDSSSSSSTPSSASSVSAPTAIPAPTEETVPPSFNLIEGNKDSQLIDGVNKQNTVPVKAYVLQKDISSASEAERNIEETAQI